MDSIPTCKELEQQQQFLANKRHPPPPKPHYFIRDEVCIHYTPDDAWVIVNDRVIDLTPFLRLPDVEINEPLQQLLAYAGKDLSHYFTAENQPRTRISERGAKLPTLAATQVATLIADGRRKPVRMFWWQVGTPWEIGRITSAERNLRIINTMTRNSVCMTVCEEDTLNDIRAKYNRRYNSHSGSYTWRKTARNRNGVDLTGSLDNTKTLTQNGILKEASTSIAPTIWLFYNDDFTIA